MKTGVKVSVDNEKKIIVSIRKSDLAKSSADARPEVFSPGNALDAKITELDNTNNHISLDVEFKMIVVNSRKLPIEAFEGVKCATVITSLGEFPLITSEKDATD